MAGSAETVSKALALLAEELESSELEHRIEACKRLGLISRALGPEESREKLIPYLTEHVPEDDEAMFEMAKSIGGLVGGLGEGHGGLWLPILGTIAKAEETVVRDEAVRVFNAVAKTLDASLLVKQALPVLDALTNGEWFTERVSACGCVAALLRCEDAESLAAVRGLYTRLCHDETPMVRRAAASALGDVAAAVTKDQVIAEILPCFKDLAADHHDTVRLLAVQQAANIAKLMTEAENNTHILELVKSCAEDNSWRIRLAMAQSFFGLSQGLGAAVTSATLLPLFVGLLQDVEAEARAAAVKSLSGYHDLIGAEKFISTVVPCLPTMAMDVALNVRVELSKVVVDLATKLGQRAATTHILPLAMQFLRDDASEVRLNVLENLRAFTDVIGVELVVSSIVPTIIALSADKQWRVRQSVASVMPLLAEVVGVTVYESKLLPLFFAYFHDSVAAVRMAACTALGGLAATFGGSWTTTRVLPTLQQKFDSSYMQRVGVLYAVKSLLASSGDMSEAFGPCLRLVQRGAKDSVSNVRHVAARVLVTALGVVGPELVESDVKPTLSELSGDEDDDVRYCAAVALEKSS